MKILLKMLSLSKIFRGLNNKVEMEGFEYFKNGSESKLI